MLAKVRKVCVLAHIARYVVYRTNDSRCLDVATAGGAVFDAVLPPLNARARIPVCGLTAAYNATELPPSPD